MFVNRIPVDILVEMYPLYFMTSQFDSNSVAFVTLLSSGRNETLLSFGSYQQVVMIYVIYILLIAEFKISGMKGKGILGRIKRSIRNATQKIIDTFEITGIITQLILFCNLSTIVTFDFF